MSRKRENYLSILLVMVWFTLNNAARSIELFNENQAYHLVRESHFRKRNLFVGTIVHRFRKPIRATDNKHKSLCCVLFLLQPCGIVYRTELFTVLVEQHNRIRRLYFL